MKFPAYWPSGLDLDETDTSFDPNTVYYGIFDPTKRYAYDSTGNYFYETSSGEWSGSFLNWLTMRRYDILLKILVGGNYKVGVNGNKFIQGFNTLEKYIYVGHYIFKKKCSYRGFFPSVYIGKTFYVGVDRDGINEERTDRNDRFWFKVGGKYYAIRLKVDEQPAGILHAMPENQIRLGIMVFNHGDRYEDDIGKDGGYVVRYIADIDNTTSIADIFLNQDVYETDSSPLPLLYPHNWTPLAETLYEAVRYFKAEASAYNSVNYANYDPIQYWCQKNFVILITDGESTKDQNLPGTCFSGYGVVRDSSFNIKNWMDKIASNEGYSSQWCSSLSSDGSYYLEGVAYYSHVSDLRSDLSGKQTLTLFTIYTFGRSERAVDILSKAAKYGGFSDSNNNAIPDIQAEWDSDNDGTPDNFFMAPSARELRDALEKVLNAIIAQTLSGTSVSVLSEKAQNGMLSHQAVFYPVKKFVSENQTTEVTWIGYLYTWWLYNSFIVQNIREDTNENKQLDITADWILEWILDESGNLQIKAYSSYANGTRSILEKTYNSFDETHPVWEAGEKLAQENATERKIYTVSSENTLVEFTKNNKSAFSAYFGNNTGFPSCLDNSADNLIEYIRGKDIEGCRNRTTDSGKVWKLGDIIYSTPIAVEYPEYSVVFVGANDGMLHAFRAGYLTKRGFFGSTALYDSSTSNTYAHLGEELWAFIPKNALPYLRYLADPEYCHVYFVDLPPYIISIKGRRILIGGMRFGGATGCNSTSAVNPPDDTCTDPQSDNCVGRSSYFALDVTNPEQPEFLWEFTDKDLGFTYSGPAHITHNGNHYIMFASGPTSYNGTSEQPLKFFILELSTNGTIGSIKETYTKTLLDFPNSFGGRLFTEGVDYNGDGNTDMVFVGVNKSTEEGNVIGIKITDEDPDNWQYVKLFSSNINPVVSKIEYMKCFNENFIYFGTGRWFFKTDNSTSQNNKVYGIRIDACLNDIEKCEIDPLSDLYNDENNVCNALLQDDKTTGWYVELDPEEEGYMKEKDVSDPTPSEQNIIFFTTIQPTGDICGFGGRSRMWALNCATGGNSNSGCPEGAYRTQGFQGTLFLQLSGGNIVQITEETFTENNNRATPWYKGIAPETATPLVSPRRSKGELILWIER